MVQAGLEAEATEFYARARARTRAPSSQEGLSCEIGSRGVEAAIGFKEMIPFLSAKYSLSRLQGQEDEYAETCKHRENILDSQLLGDCVSKVCTLRIKSGPC